MMSRRTETLFAFALAAALAACQSEPEPVPMERGEAREAPPATPVEKDSDPGEEAEPAAGGGASLTRAKNTIFGIVIPRGMAPAKGPEGVYRFSGVYPVPHVVTAIKGQIFGQRTVQEGAGVAYRNARLISPTGDPSMPRALGIRISENAEGTAVLDIWPEADGAVQKKKAGRRPLPAHVKEYKAAARKLRTDPVEVNPTVKRRRAAAQREQNRVMRKFMRGEKLSSEDLEHFH